MSRTESPTCTRSATHSKRHPSTGRCRRSGARMSGQPEVHRSVAGHPAWDGAECDLHPCRLSLHSRPQAVDGFAKRSAEARLCPQPCMGNPGSRRGDGRYVPGPHPAHETRVPRSVAPACADSPPADVCRNAVNTVILRYGRAAILGASGGGAAVLLPVAHSSSARTARQHPATACRNAAGAGILPG